ncbi:MAG: ribosome maturation factor RimP [Deltaproteobacteria bacterium]|nr:ribosome maturation factor RimP [Deltaproteobacteria bacterium]
MSLYTEKVIKIVKELAIPILEREALELVDIEFKREVRGWVLRIYIDKEGGVSLNDCTLVSQQLGDVLDVEDPIDTPYILEVSSPGLTRPLKGTKDYQRYIGRLVKIKTYKEIYGKKVFIGELSGLKEGIVNIKIDKKVYEIPYGLIASAHLEVDF